MTAIFLTFFVLFICWLLILTYFLRFLRDHYTYTCSNVPFSIPTTQLSSSVGKIRQFLGFGNRPDLLLPCLQLLLSCLFPKYFYLLTQRHEKITFFSNPILLNKRVKEMSSQSFLQSLKVCTYNAGLMFVSPYLFHSKSIYYDAFSFDLSFVEKFKDSNPNCWLSKIYQRKWKNPQKSSSI